MAARNLGAAVLMLPLVAGCLTPQTMIASALIPDGTTSVLLSHLQGEDDANRRRVAELEAKKDWDGLVKFSEQNLKADQYSAPWWMVAGYAHSKAGRYQRAVDCYAELVRLSPDDPLAPRLLAQAYRDAKQSERAVQVLNNSTRVRDGSAETYFLLGESYADLNRDLPAAAAYREAVKRNEQFAQAWYGLGRASARINRVKDYEQALKALETLKSPLAKQLAELRPGPR